MGMREVERVWSGHGEEGGKAMGRVATCNNFAHIGT